MVKVQPLFKKPQGVLYKRIKYFSKFYLLPFDIIGDDRVNFSFLSWKSFVHVILHVTPFTLSLVWLLLQPSNVLGKIAHAFKSVYTYGDISVMAFFPGSMIIPLASGTFVFVFCSSLPPISDLVFDPSLNKPKNYKTIMFSRLLELTGLFLVSFGNYLALSPHLPYTKLEAFSYLFLPAFIPSSLNSSLIAFLAISLFGIMESLLQEMKRCPRVNVEQWVRRNIDTFQRFQKTISFQIFGFIASR